MRLGRDPHHLWCKFFGYVLVLQATNAGQAMLSTGVAVYVLEVVALHARAISNVSVAFFALASTPPETDGTDIVETAIGTGAATRHSRKTIRIIAIAVPATRSF